MNDVIKYNDGEIELAVSVLDRTIWLVAEDIAFLFGIQRPAIVKHIGNIYKDEELDKNSTCSILEQIAKDGKTRKINHYNLDMIISIGYRVNSKKATKFRQWATTILREYIENGYAINNHKITEQRLLNLEYDMNIIKTKIIDNSIKIKQGIFYDGEFFDAHIFILELINKAKKEIILIDNYIDENTLLLFKNNQNIRVKIFTQKITKTTTLSLEKYNKQYQKIELKILNRFHDRFLLIDNEELYFIGASLKDLGNKTFAFSKLNLDIEYFLGQLK